MQGSPPSVDGLAFFVPKFVTVKWSSTVLEMVFDFLNFKRSIKVKVNSARDTVG